jgi:site-specific DNA-methyltransferase (cytosine-N4-specific)
MLSNNDLYTHNLFPYPAKFPALPIRKHIEKYSFKGDTILDPFCGSGTVLVEALLNDRNAFGIELNPVAVRVSKAKTNVYATQDTDLIAEIIGELKEIEENRDRWISQTIENNDIPKYKNIELWFKENMLFELTALKKYFINKSSINRRLNELLWMALLKIIVPVSNQDTDTRYTAVEKDSLVDGYAIQLFRKTLEDYHSVILKRLPLINSKNSIIKVIEGDVNENIVKINNNSIDMVITSPPYINTYDYYLYHKQRIFWLGENPQEIRRQEIGCHHRVDSMSYEKALNEYTTNMDKLFRRIHEKLKIGKYFIMLIGDGIVKDKMVYADKLISEIALNNGFSVEHIDTISLKEVSRGFIKGRNSDKKKHHVIVMRGR